MLLALILLIGLLTTFIQLGILTIAFDKLGLSPGSALLLLLTSLIGSAINLPLFKIKAEIPPSAIAPPVLRDLFGRRLPTFTGTTLIAINVGGGLVPICFSFFLLTAHVLPIIDVVLATVLVAIACNLVSRPLPGIGIGMPILIAPLSAAIIALLINPQQSAPLAYICGTIGVLIGADILKLKYVRRMGAPIASIGGAGTFDGVFITGIVAAILA
jgi:uncharacterized membrane protein